MVDRAGGDLGSSTKGVAGTSRRGGDRGGGGVRMSTSGGGGGAGIGGDGERGGNGADPGAAAGPSETTGTSPIDCRGGGGGGGRGRADIDSNNMNENATTATTNMASRTRSGDEKGPMMAIGDDDDDVDDDDDNIDGRCHDLSQSSTKDPHVANAACDARAMPIPNQGAEDSQSGAKRARDGWTEICTTRGRMLCSLATSIDTL